MPAQRIRVTAMSTSGTLTLDVLLGAEVAIICYCQQQRFAEEISALSSKKSHSESTESNLQTESCVGR